MTKILVFYIVKKKDQYLYPKYSINFDLELLFFRTVYKSFFSNNFINYNNWKEQCEDLDTSVKQWRQQTSFKSALLPAFILK